MIAGLSVTMLYVFQHKGILFIPGTTFLGDMKENWFLGISPNAFGAIGAIPPGQGVVVGNVIPYQASALEQKQRNFENRYTDDPEIKCFLPGVPRATYLPFPFQIIQGDTKIMIV